MSTLEEGGDFAQGAGVADAEDFDFLRDAFDQTCEDFTGADFEGFGDAVLVHEPDRFFPANRTIHLTHEQILYA